MHFLRECVKKDVFKLKLGSYLETPLQKAKVCYAGGLVLERNQQIRLMSKRSSSCVNRLSPSSPPFSSTAQGELREGWFCPLQAVIEGTLIHVFSGPCAAEVQFHIYVFLSLCTSKDVRILLKKVKWEALTSIFLDIMCNDATLLHELWQAFAYGRCGKRE